MRMPLMLAAVAALAPSLAAAVEPPEQEFRALARCSAATAVYELIVVESDWALGTAADKSLAVRATAADKVLGDRGGELVVAIGKEKAAAIFQEETDAATARLDKDGEDRAVTARAVLDFYAPVLEDCVARAGQLIG